MSISLLPRVRYIRNPLPPQEGTFFFSHKSLISFSLKIIDNESIHFLGGSQPMFRGWPFPRLPRGEATSIQYCTSSLKQLLFLLTRYILSPPKVSTLEIVLNQHTKERLSQRQFSPQK